MAKKTYSQGQRDELLSKLPDKPTYAQIKEVAKANGVNEITLLTWVKRQGSGITPTKSTSKRSTAKTYTHPAGLNAGDKVEVVDGALDKDNGKLITITRVGKIFIEGVDENNKPVAAYKVKRAVTPQPAEAPERVAPIIEPTPEPVQAVDSLPVSDEIIWERKLVYDVQTTNHLYRVKVETNTIEILNGESDVITINKDRVADISLILKNLPALLEEN